MKDITDFQQDALAELSNILAAKVSTVLATLIQKPVEMTSTNKNFVVTDKQSEIAFGPGLHVNIFSKLKKGTIDGNIVLSFNKQSALFLHDHLTKQEFGNTKIIDEDVKNVLGEVGSIVSGKVLSVLSKLLDAGAEHSVPEIVPAMGENITDYIFFNLKNDKEAILINLTTNFNIDPTPIKGYLILCLTHDSFEYLLEKIAEVEE